MCPFYLGFIGTEHNALFYRRPFFRYFAVDLLSSCGYLPSLESSCTASACEIIPGKFKAITKVIKFTENKLSQITRRSGTDIFSPDTMKMSTGRSQFC